MTKPGFVVSSDTKQLIQNGLFVYGQNVISGKLHYEIKHHNEET